MSRLQGRNKKPVERLAMFAVGALLAQGMVQAQTSEDNSQTGPKTSDKTNPKAPGKMGKPAPKPEPTQPLALSVATDRKTYAVGTAIKMTLTAKNTTPQTMNLNFNNGQKYDFVLREGAKPDGKIVWQWSKGRMFTMMITNMKLEPGKSLSFSDTYDPKATAGGEPLKAGTYTLTATLATFGTRPTATTQVVIK